MYVFFGCRIIDPNHPPLFVLNLLSIICSPLHTSVIELPPFLFENSPKGVCIRYPDLEEFGSDYGLAIIHYLETVHLHSQGQDV